MVERELRAPEVSGTANQVVQEYLLPLEKGCQSRQQPRKYRSHVRHRCIRDDHHREQVIPTGLAVQLRGGQTLLWMLFLWMLFLWLYGKGSSVRVSRFELYVAIASTFNRNVVRMSLENWKGGTTNKQKQINKNR